MSTKFVSKNANYMLVLKPGIEGSRALGTQAIPGLYVRFDSGIINVSDQKIIDQLRSHPSFGTDFIEVAEHEADPYVDTREDIEPDHVMQEIKYGHAEGMKGSVTKLKITPQLKKIIEGEAIKMLPKILKANPKILKDLLVTLSKEAQEKEAPQDTQPVDTSSTEEVKRGPGRPSSKVE